MYGLYVLCYEKIKGQVLKKLSKSVDDSIMLKDIMNFYVYLALLAK